ncbi:MAG: exodeoxyribonuclease VII small subunit [Pseudomonadota bacterium]|nr:exodeoxyribonuclease VII small subunit [Pseudomonadota bacterium]
MSEQPKFVIEDALKELESIVNGLENQNLSIEQALKAFERGIKISNQCQKELNQAEQRISMLTEQGMEEQQSLIADTTEQET